MENEWIFTDEDKWDHLDDGYENVPMRGKYTKPVNNRMATLNRQQGIINRYRNAGIL